MLAPQYRTGHGLEAYAFAIDKQSGDAFPLEFVKKGIVFKTIVYSELKPIPSNINERLVVHPPIGAGGPPEEDTVYQLDWSNKQFVAE